MENVPQVIVEKNKPDFDKAASVNSDTRLYMQAGNSIVVNVLEALFRNMLN